MHWVSRALAELEDAEASARTPEEAAAVADADAKAGIIADYKREQATGTAPPAVIRSGVGSNGQAVP